MESQRAAKPALMLPPESNCAGDLGQFEVGARITPLAAPPEWLRNFGRDGWAALLGDPERQIEERFWNEPPRYSETGGGSLSPAPTAKPHSRLRVWATRLLFGALLGGVVGLLACELSRI